MGATNPAPAQLVPQNGAMTYDGRPAPNYYGYSGAIPVEANVHPFETGFYNMRQTEFGELVQTALTESWLRVEYLLWNIDAPGSTLLGAPVLGVFNPRDPFTTTTGGIAKVEDLSEIKMWDNNGIRATMGIPLAFGTFEVGGFIVAQRHDLFDSEELPGTTPLIATSTLINGEVSDLLRAYNRSFGATYGSDIWGLNANVVFDEGPQGEGIKHRPIVGLRFLNVNETLGQVGVSSATPDFVTQIDSDCMNNIYGVNLGWESVLEHRWFTLGVRPQITLGLNSFRNRVSTEGFVFADEPRRTNELTNTEFSPVGELTLFARIPVSDNMRFTVGFTGMWIGNVERPGESIVYNTTAVGGIPTEAAFHARRSHDDMKVYGLTVGGEIIFK